MITILYYNDSYQLQKAEIQDSITFEISTFIVAILKDSQRVVYVDDQNILTPLEKLAISAPFFDANNIEANDFAPPRTINFNENNFKGLFAVSLTGSANTDTETESSSKTVTFEIVGTGIVNLTNSINLQIDFFRFNFNQFNEPSRVFGPFWSKSNDIQIDRSINNPILCFKYKDKYNFFALRSGTNEINENFELDLETGEIKGIRKRWQSEFGYSVSTNNNSLSEIIQINELRYLLPIMFLKSVGAGAYEITNFAGRNFESMFIKYSPNTYTNYLWSSLSEKSTFIKISSIDGTAQTLGNSVQQAVNTNSDDWIIIKTGKYYTGFKQSELYQEATYNLDSTGLLMGAFEYQYYRSVDNFIYQAEKLEVLQKIVLGLEYQIECCDNSEMMDKLDQMITKECCDNSLMLSKLDAIINNTAIQSGGETGGGETPITVPACQIPMTYDEKVGNEITLTVSLPQPAETNQAYYLRVNTFTSAMVALEAQTFMFEFDQGQTTVLDQSFVFASAFDNHTIEFLYCVNVS